MLISMGVFVRAVVTGFGLSLGSSLYKKVSKRLGFDDGDDQGTKIDPDTATGDRDDLEEDTDEDG